jgi:Domain of unknown function (DUF4340)/Protein kinase C terminal domain
MKKHHLLLLVAAAIVVGLGGIYFQISRSAAWNESKTDRSVFQNLAINDVTKIQIRSSASTVTLEKKGAEWRVAERADYPADFEKIRDLIKTLWSLRAGQEMQVGPSQFGRLKVLPPGQGSDTGIEIDLKGEKEANIASLIVGKSVDRSDNATGAAASGRFVFSPAVKDRVYLVSETFFSIDPLSVGPWLDKTFIVPGDLKEIDQAAWSNNPGWKIIRDDPKADWRLENLQLGEALDKSFAQSVSNFSPSFTDVRPASTSPDETGLNDPFQIRIKAFDGFTYDLLVGKQGPDKTRYIQVRVSADLPSVRTPDPKESQEDKKKKDEEFDKRNADLKQRLEKEKRFEKWVFLVPDWSLEQILKRRNEIVSKASPSPLPTPAVAAPSPNASTPSPRPEASASPSASPAPSPAASPAPVSTPSSSASPSPSPTPGA